MAVLFFLWNCRRLIVLAGLLSFLVACGDNGEGGRGALSLSARVLGPSQVNLSWTAAPTSVSVYFVHRNGAPFDSIITGTSYPDTSANPNGTYCYVVIAVVFPVGEKSRSNEVCVRTPSSGAGWRTVTVAHVGGVGYSALRVDSVNKPHISYYDGTNGDLQYATNASGSWQSVTIDSVGDVGWYSSIDLDSLDKAHVSYYDVTNGHLKYATNLSGTWVTSTIDTTSGSGLFTSLAVDSLDHVHISYANWPATYKYVTNASGAWVSTFLSGFSGAQGGPTSIALDSNNRAHLTATVQGGTDSFLYYWTNASGIWLESIVTNSVRGDSSSSIAVDSMNELHVSYWHQAPHELRISTITSGIWILSTIETWDWFGGDTSIAIDSGGNLHISYQDRNNDLKYATDRSGTWQTSFVDSVGNVGSHNSIAVDSDGHIHISYYDATNQTIKYATR
jgi:hypothetical protein